jgi:hypothetical protein
MMNGSGTRSIAAGRDHLYAEQLVAREDDPDCAALFVGDGSRGRRGEGTPVPMPMVVQAALRAGTKLAIPGNPSPS